ncbi:TetR/AcrR family transcriptional regulator [Kutzneria sp. 744]|uniref:TetR/AcrR family transcriptional regulator n=1 Tax=Kutzneria sp. (strain 744) TaxID=345341 RepID=UPI0004B37F84|nr:TetR/AcrR family transcriptional regulator [Kutzneria sp. 744]
MAGVRQFDERLALERALDAFSERGFRATTMLDLAAGTGVQQGSPYHADGGKEEIFLRVFGEHSGNFLDGATTALEQPTKRQALTAFFDYRISAYTTGEPARGSLSTRTAIEAAKDSPKAEAAVKALLTRLENLVHDKLSTMDDDTASPVDLRTAARLIVTTTCGLAVMERAQYRPDELRAIAETLVTSLFPA